METKIDEIIEAMKELLVKMQELKEHLVDTDDGK